MKQTRLTDNQKIEAVQRYEAGESSVEIAKTFNISYTAILGILKRRNVKIRKRK